MFRLTSAFCLCSLFAPAAAAAPVALSDAAVGDVPAGYDSTTTSCASVCTFDAVTYDVVCTIDQNPNPTKGNGSITAVTDYSGSAPSRFSFWGVEDAGNPFGCTLDATTDSVGAVSLFGDEGNDVIALVDGTGNKLSRPSGWSILFRAYVDGDVSADTITSTPAHDVAIELHGGEGNDKIYGDDRVETIYGFYPTSHFAYHWFQSDDDVIYGGGGNDTIYGGPERDAICGDLGHDTIHGDDGTDDDDADWIEGGGGDDVILGYGGPDCLLGYVTTSIVGCEHWPYLNDPGCTTPASYMTDDDTIEGGDLPDIIHGGPGDDFLYGEEGNDTVDGNQGDDTVSGGPGDDRMTGGIGNDLLSGDEGNDRINGDPGADALSGGAGDDLLCGGGGSDAMVDLDDYTSYAQLVGSPASVTRFGTNNVCDPAGAAWWSTSWCSYGPILCP